MLGDAMRDVKWVGRRGLTGLVLACAAVGSAAAKGGAGPAAKGSAGMEPPKGERCTCGVEHEGDAPTVHKANCTG